MMSQAFTEFEIYTTRAENDKTLTRDTDVVVVTFPSLPGNGKYKPIPLKILTFPAKSQTWLSAHIHSKIGVCTVKEKENGVLIPELSETLPKGGDITLKYMKKEGGLRWEFTSPPPYVEKDVHDNNTGVAAEQQTAPTHTTTASADDYFVIKNEHEDVRLALCLIDQYGARLPIVDLGVFSKNQMFINHGQLYVQAYAMVGQTMGKPLELTDCDPFKLLAQPMAVADLSQYSFKLYTGHNGPTVLEKSLRDEKLAGGTGES